MTGRGKEMNRLLFWRVLLHHTQCNNNNNNNNNKGPAIEVKRVWNVTSKVILGTTGTVSVDSDST